ncbi:hypothetical protein pdam_00002611 [Pocillopora damicornis]|uniref:Uncharacterized protein n=1 Tax=Pocillopora damicornis TaxID=46731 RepID=A0A3M6U328_POCDA|nr:hypothetical protein pdam_00002611 [Pocillopora damicornis]
MKRLQGKLNTRTTPTIHTKDKQRNPFTQAVRNQEPQDSELESPSSHSDTGLPRIRKTVNKEQCSPRKRKNNDDRSYKSKRIFLWGQSLKK